MRRWSDAAGAVGATGRTSEKIAVLASYLRSLDPVDLPVAVTFLAGRPFPQGDERALGLGWVAIATAAERVAHSGPGALARHYEASSDLGRAVEDLLAEAASEGQRAGIPALPELSLPEVLATFEAIAAAPAAQRAALLEALLRRADPTTAKFLVKVMGGDMRIGLRDGHLEAAIAAAFDRPAAAVQWAGMLTGDLGETALMARDNRLEAAELAMFRPLRSMLASPVADPDEALARLGAPVWVEDKYDGIRAQLHKVRDEVRLFTRDLHDVSRGFPEVVAAARPLPFDLVLDGELLAWHEGGALPFQRLQARLGRKRPSAALIAETPVIFVAFDLLAAADPAAAPGRDQIEPLLRLPLRDRRRRLEALGLAEQPGLGVARREQADDVEALEQLFAEARGRGNEGLMVKDPDTAYTPGRRGYGWLKLKRPLATLDCVVVGVEVGHGKRHGVLSDYTFAVLDDRADAARPLATIGKAYSGLTDAELAEMTRWFEGHTLQIHGRYRLVEPTTVVEVAFDVVQRSKRHASGFALRFPRIVRLRPDKTPAEADRLSAVERLVDQLEAGHRFLVETAGARAPRVS